MTIQPVIPILRIFDIGKMREFYVDWLGFTIDWEHRFGENFPLYCQVSLSNILLHLSEHHGDACPGTAIRIHWPGVTALCAALNAKNYRYYKPGLADQEWGTREMQVGDPFGNKLIFWEVRTATSEAS